MSERTTERSGSLVESHKGYDPRLILFYFCLAALMLALAAGLAYQQLIKTDVHQDRERMQNERLVVVPGPRGNLYDRNGELLVGNRPRFAVTLNLDELRGEFRKEFYKIRKAYRADDENNIPTEGQLSQIARFAVVQRYLDHINRSLGREDQLDAKTLTRHFRQDRLLPFILVDDLSPEEFAKLVEQLPVASPLQVTTSSTRYYPFGSAAAHTLGYVGSVEIDTEELEDFFGDELKTFKAPGSEGRDGIERKYDSVLQGKTGGTVYRVDHAGYRVNPPLKRKLPVQGQNLTLSLDIDLQMAAEKQIALYELSGAAVALDVATGEVLALASKPDYDLKDTAPRISTAKFREIEESGGWLNRAVQGLYPPGSSFKILTSIAGLRSGTLTADSVVNCQGTRMIGRRRFICHGTHSHGELHLTDAIERSCNMFFYDRGLAAGPQAIADEARRFHLDRPTGIELPAETRGMIVPDAAWKKKEREEAWYDGDTANYAIGQGFVLVTPLQMACFVASFARGETTTRPTLLHQIGRPRIHSDPIGLSPDQYRLIVQGMRQCVVGVNGTARDLNIAAVRIPDLAIAGKTGTAQVRSPKGTLNIAWFICFAPAENPEIALAVMIEGDTPGEEFAGGRYAGPVALEVIRKWWDKKKNPGLKSMAAAR